MRIGHGFDVHAFGGEGPSLAGYAFLMKKGWPTPTATSRCMR